MSPICGRRVSATLVYRHVVRKPRSDSPPLRDPGFTCMRRLDANVAACWAPKAAHVRPDGGEDSASQTPHCRLRRAVAHADGNPVGFLFVTDAPPGRGPEVLKEAAGGSRDRLNVVVPIARSNLFRFSQIGWSGFGCALVRPSGPATQSVRDRRPCDSALRSRAVAPRGRRGLRLQRPV